MKKLNKTIIFVLISSMFFVMSLTSCGDKSGNTIDEPEITSDYLHGEYAEQLITDGAETMLGYVDISKDGDTYMVHISEQEVVPNSDYDEGYYIADTNLAKDVSLGFDARIVCEEDGEQEVVTADDFIENQADDEKELYNVYLMGNSAELIMATEPEDVITEE